MPVERTAAGSGQDRTLALATSIIERDGSPTASELAKAGDLTARTTQRWIRSLRDSGKLDVCAGNAHRYVLRDGDDGEAT